MTEKSDNGVTLFIRDEVTGRLVFNTRALKLLGIDPTEARERGYLLKEPEEHQSNSIA